jgi:hypothetical protein
MTSHIGSKTLLVVGALVVLAAASVAAGLIPLSQVVWLGLLLICPLAMFFMMRGMHGGDGELERRPVPAATPTSGSDSREHN